MKKFSENAGHKDVNGNWVEESPQAKLRNQLGPFWTLVDLMSEDRLEKILNHPDGMEMIRECLEKCKLNRSTILDLIKQTEK